MTISPTADNPYTVDSTGVARGAGIPADDLDRLIAASAGPAVAVPAQPVVGTDAHPLDSVSIEQILDTLVRRVTTAGSLLRLAIAEADPAALTGDDRRALLDLLGRAFEALKDRTRA